jgi:glutaminase
MISEWMQKQGKELKPVTKQKVKKSTMNAAKRNELVDDLLEKMGYFEKEKK